MKYERIDHSDGRIEFVPENKCFEGVLKNGERFAVKLSGMIFVTCSGSGSMKVEYYSDSNAGVRVQDQVFDIEVALTPRCFQIPVSKMCFDHASLKLNAIGGDLAYAITAEEY